jgi:hypothetical protein
MIKATRKAIATTVVAVAVLAGCGGVDRSGSRDQILQELAPNATADEKKCVDGVMKDYSDSELKAIDKIAEDVATSDPKVIDFRKKVIGCVPTQLKATLMDTFAKSIPNMTPDQTKCLDDFMAGLDVSVLAEGEAAATKVGQDLATKCLTS